MSFVHVIGGADHAPWTFGWEALAAIGTIGAALAAVVIALRDGRARAAQSRSKARLALIVLWPDLRKYLAAINKLKRNGILLGPCLSEELRLELLRILSPLVTDSEIVFTHARDLTSPQAEQMARVLANIRHIYRHANDLQMLQGTMSITTYEEKRDAIKTSIGRAKTDLHALISHAKAVTRGSMDLVDES